MRAALLGSWPALYKYGVTPLNFRAYSVPELNGYVQAIVDEAREAEKRG